MNSIVIFTLVWNVVTTTQVLTTRCCYDSTKQIETISTRYELVGDSTTWMNRYEKLTEAEKKTASVSWEFDMSDLSKGYNYEKEIEDSYCKIFGHKWETIEKKADRYYWYTISGYDQCSNCKLKKYTEQDCKPRERFER